MCSTCRAFESRVAAGNVDAPEGLWLSLVEHLHGMEGVRGSNPLRSTLLGSYTLGGLVAAEGSFYVARATPSTFRDGSPRKRFVFELVMATRDRQLLEQLRALLGFGSITDRSPSHAHWQPTAALRVASRKAHFTATIPFADRHLLPSAKRRQFEQRRCQLLEYDARHPVRRGRSTCSVAGCSDPVRGRGLCRRHYYRATGYWRCGIPRRLHRRRRDLHVVRPTADVPLRRWPRSARPGVVPAPTRLLRPRTHPLLGPPNVALRRRDDLRHLVAD